MAVQTLNTLVELNSIGASVWTNLTVYPTKLDSGMVVIAVPLTGNKIQLYKSMDGGKTISQLCHINNAPLQSTSRFFMTSYQNRVTIVDSSFKMYTFDAMSVSNTDISSIGVSFSTGSSVIATGNYGITAHTDGTIHMVYQGKPDGSSYNNWPYYAKTNTSGTSWVTTAELVNGSITGSSSRTHGWENFTIVIDRTTGNPLIGATLRFHYATSEWQYGFYTWRKSGTTWSQFILYGYSYQNISGILVQSPVTSRIWVAVSRYYPSTGRSESVIRYTDDMGATWPVATTIDGAANMFPSISSDDKLYIMGQTYVSPSWRTFVTSNQHAPGSASFSAIGIITEYYIGSIGGILYSKQPSEYMFLFTSENDGGTRSGTKLFLRSLTTMEPGNTPPTPPTPTSPANNGFVNTVKPTFNWVFNDPDAGDTQTQYRLVVGKDAGVQFDIVFDTAWVSSTSKSHVSTTSLVNGTKYYWKVATMDSKGANSAWSSIFSFTVDTTPPTSTGITPTQYLNVPVGGTFRVEVTGVTDTISGVQRVRFPTWTNTNGQDDIQWYEGINAGGGTWYYNVPISNHGNAEDIYFTDPYLYDNAGNSVGVGRIFTYVDRRPPNNTTPVLSNIKSTSATVSWTVPTDPAVSSGIKHAKLYFQRNAGTSASPVWVNQNQNNTIVTGTSATLSPMLENTEYRVAITYTDNAGNENTGVWSRFYTNALPTGQVLNLVNSGYVINQRPRIKVTGTDPNGSNLAFELEISSTSSFSSTIITSNQSVHGGWNTNAQIASGGVAYYTPITDLGVGVRYARVRVWDWNVNEWGTWSATYTFTINAPNWATTVGAADTSVKKETIDDLRTKINEVRKTRGLGTKAWSDSTITRGTTKIKALHITEMRLAINEIYTALGLTNSWPTDSTMIEGVSRKGQHWLDLRTRLEQI